MVQYDLIIAQRHIALLLGAQLSRGPETLQQTFPQRGLLQSKIQPVQSIIILERPICRIDGGEDPHYYRAL